MVLRQGFDFRYSNNAARGREENFFSNSTNCIKMIYSTFKLFYQFETVNGVVWGWGSNRVLDL